MSLHPTFHLSLPQCEPGGHGEYTKHGIYLKASRASRILGKRADCGADVMSGGDRLKEHISALSGAERLSSLLNLFSPLAGICG